MTVTRRPLRQVVARNLETLKDIGHNMQFEIRERMRPSGFGDAAAAWLDARLDPQTRGSPLSRQPEWYNEDKNFLESLKALIEVKTSVVSGSTRRPGALYAAS